MPPCKFDQCFQIELMLKEGSSQSEIKARLDRLHGNNALSKSSVQRWCSQFRSEHVQKDNLLKSEAPRKCTTAQVCGLIQQDRCSTIRQLANDMNFSFGCTCHLIKEDLAMKKTPAK